MRLEEASKLGWLALVAFSTAFSFPTDHSRAWIGAFDAYFSAAFTSGTPGSNWHRRLSIRWPRQTEWLDITLLDLQESQHIFHSLVVVWHHRVSFTHSFLEIGSFRRGGRKLRQTRSEVIDSSEVIANEGHRQGQTSNLRVANLLEPSFWSNPLLWWCITHECAKLPYDVENDSSRDVDDGVVYKPTSTLVHLER